MRTSARAEVMTRAGTRRLDLLGSVRARLMALLAIAAIPLVAMAALVAWQNYEMTIARAMQTVVLARETASARHEAALEGVRQMLAAVSQASAARTDRTDLCDGFLADILALNREHYANLIVLGADGGIRCSAVPSAGDASSGSYASEAWFQRVRTEHILAIGPVRSATAGVGQVLVVAYPIMENSQFLGAVATSLNMDWFASQSSAKENGLGPVALWLGVPGGKLMPVGSSPEDALPPPATLAALLEGSAGVSEADSRGGRKYAYAVAQLPDGLELLAGYDASAEIAHGRAVLLSRFIELALLLLAGMVAVAIGVHLAVVQPLKRLTHAVRRWRGGGPFAPGSLAGVPGEVAELSNAFAQATGALAEREGQLRSAVANQDLLMQEIHHRVKNNLQIVASMLNLQASRIRLPEAKAEFQAARDRIRALATLHRHLYREGELHTINMQSFLTELCGQLFQAMGETEGERIDLEIDASELQMSSDQAVPLALIVTEAVSNAVKYAFPGGSRGKVSVQTRGRFECGASGHRG